MKSIDQACTVLGNVAGLTDFSYFPYDLQSTEGFMANISAVARTHAGTAYQILQEMVETPLGAGGIRQWYHTPAAAPLQAPVQNVAKPLADM